MSFRLKCVIPIVFFLLGLGAHKTPGQNAPASGTGTLRGHVADQTGAVIPGVRITITSVQGDVAGNATADAAGAYVVRNLAPGSYVVQAESAGFAAFVSVPVPLEAGQQQVEVAAEGAPTISTDAGSNASAVVIQGKNLDALSDDPNELSNELAALAARPPVPMAARSTSTDLPAASFRPNRQSAKSALIRTHTPRNSTGSDSGALRSSPSPAPTPSMAALS